MTAAKGKIEQVVAASKAKMAIPKTKAAETVLDQKSPGMGKLLKALEDVCEKNNCSPDDAVKSLTKLIMVD